MSDMREICTSSTSSKTLEVSDLVLRKTKTTRLIFKPIIIDNPHDKDASVKGQFVFQRKSQKNEWKECNSFPLSKLKANEWVKLELHSSEIKVFLEGIESLREI